MKLSPAVKQTTALTAVGTAVCAVIMTVVYLLIGKWNTRVLFGTLLGSAVAVLNLWRYPYSSRSNAATRTAQK